MCIRDRSTAIDLVTRVDTESEEAIRTILLDAFPDDGILGEEVGDRQARSGRRWLEDPLDGTLNYTLGFPWYCVSIALEVDGELEVAVVLDSAHDELFQARKGHGAWLGDQRLAKRFDNWCRFVVDLFAQPKVAEGRHRVAELGQADFPTLESAVG